MRKMNLDDITFIAQKIKARYRNEPELDIEWNEVELVASFGMAGVKLIMNFNNEYLTMVCDDFFIVYDVVKILVDNFDEDEETRDRFRNPY
jgi:hypothetical protein